ncbi:tyrosine--tRNA ligase [Candidatus Woesearchaeota archaeon CG10_big_fil_rev_8_21_14_0_10_44_13]|nr:MAG: tyrosine--tRNA ligase [Candidatus Woesearchaeota archaeon CG10_big_fil_rev_8_21_14_0_10_44_13]
MDIQSRLDLIRQVGEEIITEEDLKQLLETKSKPIAYDGFEPSGRIHIAQAVLRAININKMTKAGCHFKMWVADWFAWMNNKMGGDLEKIRVAGDYMLEVWKACDLDFKNIDFVWAKDVVTKEDHWKTTIDIARNSTVKRIIKCAQIMGRKESDNLSAAQIIYPCMQAADIFHLKCDIAQLGMDQRKVNMLAREVGPKLGFWKPVVVSHHMLMGLGKPPASMADPMERAMEMKMSKSKPDSAIFMTDSENEIKMKISKAYCPEKNIEENPILEYCRYIIFERFKEMDIERPEKFGGNLSFGSYKELEEVFAKGELHPMDLKQATAVYIDRLVKPVRDHFDKNAKAKKLLEQVKGFEVTR